MPLPFAWSPSPQRTIAMWDFAGAAPREHLATALPLRWPDKTPAAALDYTIDATQLLTDDSDALSVAIAGIGSLQLLGSLVIGGRATLFLAGGTPGDVPIDLTFTTLSTRRVHRIVRLLVR